MWLLRPDSGLLFWMVLVFGIVFVVLARYGFPVILGQVDARKAYIDRSLEAAREAQARLAGIQAEGDAVLARAHEEETRILTESLATRERLLAQARADAQAEGQKWLQEARRQVDQEKERAMNDLRRQVAVLSVDIAEKVLRERLAQGDEQQQLVERLLDEWTAKKGSSAPASSSASSEERKEGK